MVALPLEEALPEPSGPPNPLLFMLEGHRALLDLGGLLPAAPWLAGAPRGDGHPVLVLPGLAASDPSTGVLRSYLEHLGYAARPWRLGRNLGPRGDLGERLFERARTLADRHGRKLSLVGWSLGGIYARELAKAMPERVRQVITLGSPFRGRGRSSNLAPLYEDVVGHAPSEHEPSLFERLRQAPPVPTTAIYTRSDGVVAWEACVEEPGPRRESIEVGGSHCGLGFNPAVLYAVADRLSQPEDAWAPFEKDGLRRFFYA